jgi:hypothetical protein
VSCINSEEYSDMWMVLMVVFVLNMLIRCWQKLVLKWQIEFGVKELKRRVALF